MNFTKFLYDFLKGKAESLVYFNLMAKGYFQNLFPQALTTKLECF